MIMRTVLKCILIILYFINFSFSTDINQNVFRIGGMELSPFGYGDMETQPHQPIDSTNTGFANYYAGISLWIGGITATGDTIINGADLKNIRGTIRFHRIKTLSRYD